MCSPYEILSPEPCFVFSLGCNGISGFEEDIKSRYPHCTIHIYDPTVSESSAAKVAERTQARAADHACSLYAFSRRQLTNVSSIRLRSP